MAMLALGETMTWIHVELAQPFREPMPVRVGQLRLLLEASRAERVRRVGQRAQAHALDQLPSSERKGRISMGGTT
jgi:hypothetical protein